MQRKSKKHTKTHKFSSEQKIFAPPPKKKKKRTHPHTGPNQETHKKNIEE